MPKYHPDNGAKHWCLPQGKGELEEPLIKSTGKSPHQPSRWYRISQWYGTIYEYPKGTWRIFIDESRGGKSSPADN